MQLLPSPVDYGWTKEDEENDELQPVLMTQGSAPIEIAELISCQCKASLCRTGCCQCSKNGMKCTPRIRTMRMTKKIGQARVKLRVILKKMTSNQSNNLYQSQNFCQRLTRSLKQGNFCTLFLARFFSIPFISNRENSAESNLIFKFRLLFPNNKLLFNSLFPKNRLS